MRLTRWLQRMTLAPLLMRCLMVGTEAWTRVSSVMFWLSSRGTLRLARRSTRFPSRSAAVRSPTLFFAIVATARVPRDDDATWTARCGSELREAEHSDRAEGQAAARPAPQGGTAPVEATARKTAGRAREREAGAAANAIVSEFGEEELRLLPFCGGKVANCSAAGTTLIASADEWVGDGAEEGKVGLDWLERWSKDHVPLRLSGALTRSTNIKVFFEY
jgi:hypothetical protein